MNSFHLPHVAELWRALAYVTSISPRKTNNIQFHSLMTVKRHMKKQGKNGQIIRHYPGTQNVVFVEVRFEKICVYQRGQKMTFFVGNVAEREGMWVFKACQMELLSIKYRLPISINLIIIVIWNTLSTHTHTHTHTHTQIRHTKDGEEVKNSTNEANPKEKNWEKRINSKTHIHSKD